MNKRRAPGPWCTAVNTPGEKFGEWTVIDGGTVKAPRVRCSCGIERDVLAVNLLRGLSRSCGHTRSRRAWAMDQPRPPSAIAKADAP